MRLITKNDRVNLFLCSFFILFSSALVMTTDPVAGYIDTVTEVAPNFFNYSQSYWFAQSKPYTEGGVSFTWPDTFTGTPMVVASISSGTYSASGQVVTTVVNNTVDGCTVYVTVATTTTIGEAATDSFVVHVFAVEAGL